MCVRGVRTLQYVCRFSTATMQHIIHILLLTMSTYNDSFIPLILRRTSTVHNLDVSLGILLYKVCIQY